MRRLTTILLILCVALCSICDPCYAKGKKNNKRRGKGKGRSQKSFKISTKHSGKVTKLGEQRDVKAPNRVTPEELRASHARAFSQSPRTIDPGPAAYGLMLARKKAMAAKTNSQSRAFSSWKK